MARLATIGFETQDDLAEGLSPPTINGTGTVTYDATTKRSGSYAYKIDSGAIGNNSCGNVSVGSSNGYYRGYHYFPAYPSSNYGIIEMHTALSTVSLLIKLHTDGRLSAYGESGSQLGSTSAPVIALNTWHRIEVKVVLALGADTVEIRVDGVTILLDTATNFTANTVVTRFRFGWTEASTAANLVCYVDDLAINDGTGTAQTSWPSEGKIVLLKPISDNARDGPWKGGAGGTTSLYDAVNNLPPAGQSGSGTDTSQIRYAGSTATANYDANITSYTTAGITSSDRIMLVHSIAMHGEEASAGLKTGIITLAGNPVGANFAFDFGDNINAQGTYPTNWARVHGVDYLPSVTLGTSPVFRIRRVNTTGNACACCFMGVYVEYRPFAAAVSVSGAGSETVAGVRTRVGANALASAAALAAAGVRTKIGQDVLSAASSMTYAGVRTRVGVNTLSAASALIVSGIRTLKGITALSSHGDTLIGHVATLVRSVSLLSHGDLATAGVRTLKGVESLSSAGALVSAGVRTSKGVTTLTSHGDLVAIGARGLQSAYPLLASSAMTAAGRRTFSDALSLVGSSNITMAAIRTFAASIPLTSSGMLTTSGVRTLLDALDLSAATNLSISYQTIRNAVITLASSGTFTSSSVANYAALLNIIASGTLTTNATIEFGSGIVDAAVSLLATAAAVFSAIAERRGTLAVSSATILSTFGVRSLLDQANFTGQSNLLSSPIATYQAILGLDGHGATSLSGVRTRAVGLPFSSASVLSLTPQMLRTTLLNLSGATNIIAVAVRNMTQFVGLSSVSSFNLVPIRSLIGDFGLTSHGTLVVNPLGFEIAALALAAQGTLIVLPTLAQIGHFNVSGQSSLLSSGARALSSPLILSSHGNIAYAGNRLRTIPLMLSGHGDLLTRGGMAHVSELILSGHGILVVAGFLIGDLVAIEYFFNKLSTLPWYHSFDAVEKLVSRGGLNFFRQLDLPER